MIFNWIAGLMGRAVYGDTLNRLCTSSSHHIAVHQEAWSHRITTTCEQAGISEHNSEDGKRSIRSRGTGVEAIRALFPFDRHYNADTTWLDCITRPCTDEDHRNPNDIALYFTGADVCAFNPTTGIPLNRGGKAIWRVL